MWLAYANNVSLDIALAAVYALAAFLCHKDVYKCLLASVVSQIYCLSPLYAYTIELNPSLVFIVYASIYLTVIRFLSNYKTILACFIMALFEIVMHKAYLNELSHKGLEEWLYSNYEYIVTLLHVHIVFSLVQWGQLRFYYWRFRYAILRSFICNRVFLHL